MRILLIILMALAGGRILAQSADDGAIRFRTVDVYVDSKAQPLAAYQLEFSVTNSGSAAKIVGIEGGESPAFAEPPFYDPQAMQQERVIIAAFSTNAVSQLTKRKTRVATIHLQTSRAVEPEFEIKLQVAGNVNGNPIPAAASVEERTTK
jgi:hypothetical protein